MPTVAIIDSQSVKNTPTATEQIGFDEGKLIKGRKRVVLVNTMGHVLWADVRPANLHDGKAGVLLWEQAQVLNPIMEDLKLVYADGTFGGHFKARLELIENIEVVITRSSIDDQPLDSKMVTYKWRWIVAAMEWNVRLLGWVTTGG
ncbi:MAG: transposase [Cytophagaceae bacterium]|nr:transposase [Cytophagaceae bacterium]